MESESNPKQRRLAQMQFGAGGSRKLLTRTQKSVTLLLGWGRRLPQEGRMSESVAKVPSFG